MWASLLDTHRTSVSNTAWSPYVALKRFISRGSPVRYCLYPAFWHSSLKRNNHTVSDVDMYLHQSVRLCEDVAIYLIVMVMMMVTEPIIWYWLLLHKGRAHLCPIKRVFSRVCFRHDDAHERTERKKLRDWSRSRYYWHMIKYILLTSPCAPAGARLRRSKSVSK
jgi:hypothetical protein